MIEPELLCHPNIPKPLHGLSPRTTLGKDWWDKTRQKAYKERDYTCFACGVKKHEADFHHWLEAHEDYQINYKTGEVKLNRIVALCHCCHSFIHSGLLRVKTRKGEISEKKYSFIVKRGKEILRKAGLFAWDGNVKGGIADWGEWHLLLEGKKFYSKFKDFNEWREFYRR